MNTLHLSMRDTQIGLMTHKLQHLILPRNAQLPNIISITLVPKKWLVPKAHSLY